MARRLISQELCDVLDGSEYGIGGGGGGFGYGDGEGNG